jgi:hypothetical protein
MKTYTIEELKELPIQIVCNSKKQANKIWKAYGRKDNWNPRDDKPFWVTCYKQINVPSWMDEEDWFKNDSYFLVKETIEFSQIDFQETPEDTLKNIIIW